jgi:NTE family protein
MPQHSQQGELVARTERKYAIAASRIFGDCRVAMFEATSTLRVYPCAYRFGEVAIEWCLRAWLLMAVLLLLGGCATRPVNPPITQADPRTGYRFETRQADAKDRENLVILAFSGGGTRAAAFSYGVLEFLRRTEIVGPKGNRGRLLDEVDVITGVSGGSFTALAYGLYGDQLFADYEQRFLKRDVQGEIIARVFNPWYWGNLLSMGWGRSELAAQLYDEILFNGATFGDLNRGKGPLILASATDISTGSRFVFNQRTFDVICSDLNAVPLARAAAASSAVPVVLSSITMKNYGGTCNATLPEWAKPFLETDNPPRPAARAIRALKAEQAYADSVHRPYLHLVDGGVSDNVGMRSVLDALELLEALHEAGMPTPLDSVRRIVVFLVNSLSSPPTNWDESESPPGTIDILLKSAGTPIDAFSFEATELLKDTAARWRSLRQIGSSAAFASNKDPAIAAALRVPAAEIYAIDVSFPALKDKEELAYLNLQPTTFFLAPEAVDRLRAAAGTIIMASPEFQRLLKDVGAKIMADPPRAARQQ